MGMKSILQNYKFGFVEEKFIRPIPDVVLFQEGPGVRNTQYTSSGVKLLNVANLVDGKVDLSTSDRYISKEEAYGKYRHFLVDEGDLIIASSGIKVEYFEKKMGFISSEQLPLCMNTSTIRFKALNPAELNIRYFMYYLKSKSFKQQLGQQITGSAQLNFGPSHLKKMYMPMIDIVRQNDVCYILDKISNLTEKRKSQLQGLDTIIKARFVEMFGDPILNEKGWDIVTIGDIVTEVRYGTSKPAVEGGKYPYLRMNNLTSEGHLDLTDLKYIDIPDDEIEKCTVRKGDVLFNRTNSIELVGKTAVFDLPQDMVIAGYIIRVRLNQNVLPEVLSQYMNLEAIKDILRVMAKGAVNQANINAQELQSIKVYIPDMELQKQFIDMKEHVDKLRVEIQKSLNEMQTLFDSLMQQYFG